MSERLHMPSPGGAASRAPYGPACATLRANRDAGCICRPARVRVRPEQWHRMSRARRAARCAIVGQAHPVNGILMSTSVARLTTPQGPGYATRPDLTPIALGEF